VSELREKPFVWPRDQEGATPQCPPPFITPSSSRTPQPARLHRQKTDDLAQRLYEGVELGEDGQTALITYMAPIPSGFSPDAVAGARAYVEGRWGKEYLPAEPVQFKTKKSAQDAHEAIRPTSPSTAGEVEALRGEGHVRLYELIWNAFIACQMGAGGVRPDHRRLPGGRATFRATGQTSSSPATSPSTARSGETPEEAGAEKMERDEEKGDVSRQLPPPRSRREVGADFQLSRAALHAAAAALHRGIAGQELREGHRPSSTYAAILSTIQDRVVEKKEGRFFPTDLGRSSPSSCWGPSRA